MSIANDHFIEGGMGVLKGYRFNDVFVYTEEQFQDEAMKGKKSVFEMLPSRSW